MEKKFFWTSLATIILLAGALEFTPALDGLLVNPDNGTLEFVAQLTMILITLCEVYVALKLIKGKTVVRTLMLTIPAVLNVLCYHLFVNNSFLYLAVILLVGFAFIYPAKPEAEENEQK